jgi:cysteinyl-tRNA synthetase
MKLYNSLSKQTEEFKPISEEVTIYSCGPTVYNNLHIGNLSAFIYADLLRRTIGYKYPKVKHVMNITDVDDKTIRDSKIAYPDLEPMSALEKLTKKYTKVFLDDLKKTGNDIDGLDFVSAVQTIPEMIKLTQKLLDNNFAYITDDGVYFSIAQYIDAGNVYGVLQKIQANQSKQRIANDEYDKDDVSDFALWKAMVDGEPYWDGDFKLNDKKHSIAGRPGWHIECSAMSQKLLGIPFDIHTGGIDLKFPHHENEIAQSSGAESSKLANYFVHNNHILVDGKKMSKSLNNFYTLRDLEDSGYSPISFRILVLESHYQNESNFSWEILSSASNRLAKWREISDLRWQLPQSNSDASDKLHSALSDNLDTPQALKLIDQYFAEVIKENASPNDNFLENINKLLGIDLLGDDISDEAKELIETRDRYKRAGNFDEADKIRDQLKSINIGINDSSSGQIWYRIVK